MFMRYCVFLSSFRVEVIPTSYGRRLALRGRVGARAAKDTVGGNAFPADENAPSASVTSASRQLAEFTHAHEDGVD